MMGMVASKWTAVGLATILHFLVDGLCVCSLYLMVRPETMYDWAGMLLTYNLLAFTTQPLTGWWTDRMHRLHWALLLSIGLLTTAVVLLMVAAQWLQSTTVGYWLVAILLGLGNSLFHVWGGKMTVRVVGNDMRALGVFVSTGAVGLVVGVTCAAWWLAAGMMLLIALVGSLAIRIPLANMACVEGSRSEVCRLHTNRLELPRKWEIWLIPILLFVLVRSFVGESIPLNLEKDNTMLFVLAATAMVGKAGGGWVAHRWGVGTAIVACVGVAAACLLWIVTGTPQLPAVLIGVLAINFTMPMTLYLANRVLPGREGQAFGLLAAVLVPGYMLAHSSALPVNVDFMLAALLLTISVELGMLRLMGEKSRRVFVGAVIINVLTNVPLNLVLLTVGTSVVGLLTGELLVLVVEALGYYFLVRSWKRAIIYSLLCNVASFVVGALVQI